MSKALIVYHSVYGNTERVAEALANGMENSGVAVDCNNLESVEFHKLSEYDMLIIGGPTHRMGISKPTNVFLERLKTVEGLNDRKAFAFDTKTKSWLAGSAGAKIDEKLKSLGLIILRPYASAIVKGMKGPLEADTEETFRQIGIELAKLLLIPKVPAGVKN